MQRAFRYGQGNHICVVVAGVTKYLPVAPFEMPNFTDLSRVMVSRNESRPKSQTAKPNGMKVMQPNAQTGGLWTPASGFDLPEEKAA